MGDSSSSRQRKALADALAGVVASLVSLWSFYPIDTLKVRLQSNHNANSSNATRSLYRGVGIKTLHTASSSFCYFYIYSWISSRFRGAGRPSTLRRLLLSAIAAMLNTCLTLPLDVLSAKQQTKKTTTTETMDTVWNESDTDIESDDSTGNVPVHEDEKKDDTTLESRQPQVTPSSLAQTNTEPESLERLWKGLYPSLLLCSNPSIHYTVFDSVKSRILQSQQENLTMAQAFVVGLLAKFVATMVTYPLIRTKILLMVTSEKSMLTCLQQEYAKHGIQGWYRACHLQLFHTLLKSALLMMVREKITVTTQRLLVPSDNR